MSVHYNFAVKNWFLLLKTLILEHTLAKQISCDINIYTPGSGARYISIKKKEFNYFKVKIIPFIKIFD